MALCVLKGEIKTFILSKLIMTGTRDRMDKIKLEKTNNKPARTSLLRIS